MSTLHIVVKKKLLEVTFASELKYIYSNEKLNSIIDLTIFRPICPPGYRILGDLFQETKQQIAPFRSCIIVKDDPFNVQPPIDFELIWSDKDSGAEQNLTIWRPIPPPNYVSIGILSNASYFKPQTDLIFCVHKSLVAECEIGKEIWNSKGAMTPELSFWQINPLINTIQTGFVEYSTSYNSPNSSISLLHSKIHFVTPKVEMISKELEFKENKPKSKLLILGIDGCRNDCLMKTNSKNLKSLMSKSYCSLKTQVNEITLSGPGWSSFHQGVWSLKHNVRNNNLLTTDVKNYPTLFKRIKDHYPNAILASVCHWSPINDQLFSENINQTYTARNWSPIVFKKDSVKEYISHKSNHSSDIKVKEEAIHLLKNNNVDALFLHFDDVDAEGHSTGFSPENLKYLEAIERVDSYVGQVLSSVNWDDDWMVMVVTDHGGYGKGHYVNNPECRTAFLVVYGNKMKPGFDQGESGIVDAYPIALHHMGIKINENWKLDGKLVGIKNE
jgi:hypothetical protein